MSNPNNAPAEEAPVKSFTPGTGGTTSPGAAATPEPEEQPTDKGNPEAAKYRTRLRDVETERDGLRAQLTAMRKHEIEQVVEAEHIKPAALWAAGIVLDDLLDDEGIPDAEKVAQAITQARETLGIPDIPRAPMAGVQGHMGSDIEPTSEEPAPTWGDVLTRK